jgi:hypothetical protein
MGCTVVEQVMRSMKSGMSGLRLAVGLALLGGLLVPLGAEGAAPRLTRTVTQSYSLPTGTALTVVSPGAWIPLQAREDRVVVENSARILTQIDYTAAGSGQLTSTQTCDSSTTLAVGRGSQVRAEPLLGLCPGNRPSVPTSGSYTFTLSAPAPVPARRPGIPAALRWAALVGIQDYASPTHDTVGGTEDVIAVKRALLHSGWRSDHILVVSGKDASAAGIQHAMSWLAAHSSPKTFSLFHYSGHVCIASRGGCPSGHTWLWSQDNRFLSEDSVAAQLRQVKGHAWFDFAGCESGAFDVGLHSANVLFTSASQANETAYEVPEWKESVWTGLLWERGYDGGQASNGVHHGSDVGSMSRYAQARAVELTSKQSAGSQHPVVVGGNPRWSLSNPS